MPSASTSNVRVESVVLESTLTVAALILSALGLITGGGGREVQREF